MGPCHLMGLDDGGEPLVEEDVWVSVIENDIRDML